MDFLLWIFQHYIVTNYKPHLISKYLAPPGLRLLAPIKCYVIQGLHDPALLRDGITVCGIMDGAVIFPEKKVLHNAWMANYSAQTPMILFQEKVSVHFVFPDGRKWPWNAS